MVPSTVGFAEEVVQKHDQGPSSYCFVAPMRNGSARYSYDTTVTQMITEVETCLAGKECDILGLLNLALDKTIYELV